jgi:hypothetical protein
MNNELPTEIWYEILKILPLKEFILMIQINTTIKELVKIVPKNEKAKIKNVQELKYIIEKYNSKNLDLTKFQKITNNELIYLSDCHTLNLNGCNKITDAGLAHLSNCHILHLFGCNKITDEALAYLSNCHIIR